MSDYHSIEPTHEQLETECSICLQACEQNIVETECKHIFHEECIDQWIKQSCSCPMCRKNLGKKLPTNIVNNFDEQSTNNSSNLVGRLNYLTHDYDFDQHIRSIPYDSQNSSNQLIDNLPYSLYPFDRRTNSIPYDSQNSSNQRIDNLPQSLSPLTFGNSLNHRIDNLPNSLSPLTFGNSSNHQIDNLQIFNSDQPMMEEVD
jgi:hypothetical protein